MAAKWGVFRQMDPSTRKPHATAHVDKRLGPTGHVVGPEAELYAGQRPVETCSTGAVARLRAATLSGD